MQGDGEAGTAVVLGAYGFIGSSCVSALKTAGFKVVGVGRSMETGLQSDPEIEWLERDIAQTKAHEWARDLANADVVVNASGALQDGVKDNLQAIHETSVARIIEGLESSKARFIQISAAGVSDQASTSFMRSKMQGDKLIMASKLDWIILRPTLVIGSQAYGGTALLRACAAFPLLGFRIFPDTPVQTVSVEDVAGAVVQIAQGDITPGTVADLTEAEQYRFQDVVRAVRRWQGFPRWRMELPVPGLLTGLASRTADALGWLGWRSPLRTNALKALRDGITGDARGWEAAGGNPCRSLAETLTSIPATVQERWFARMYLLLPMAIAVLSLFWIASGVIGLVYRDAAIFILTDRGLSSSFSNFSVITGGIIDIVLGLMILVRKLTRTASIGMAAVSVSYMAGAMMLTPDLWADPLGPMVKVLPGIMLAFIVAALMEKR